MDLPEQRDRRTIDELLTAAGWVVQNRADFDRNADIGVAVREFSLPAGPCDYLLFLDGKAAGVIEAKREGVTLSGVAEQSARYMDKLPEHMARWDEQLVYGYESTGTDTWFINRRDPKSRSRRLFAFHRPGTPREWLQQPDGSLEDIDSLPTPDVLAAEIVDNLETALEQFSSVSTELN